jgi:hypothetical protein
MKTGILRALLVRTAGIALCGIALCGSASASTAIGASEVEVLVHSFYGQIAAYDYAGMHAATTPEFEMIENDGTKAMRMNWDAFDKRLAGAQEHGAVLKFEPSEFNTTVTSGAAYTTYIETATNGAQYYAGITLRLVGDKWLIDRMFTMPKPKIEPPADAAASAAPESTD